MKHDRIGKEFVLLLIMISIVITFPKIKCMRWLPPAVFAVLLGMFVSVIAGQSVIFETEIFLYLGLPPILFHSALKFKYGSLRRTWISSVTFSWCITLMSVVLIAWGILVWTRDTSNAMSLTEALLLASVLAPTDTEATLSLTHNLAENVISLDSRLVLDVLENESVMNDAISIVLVHLWVTALDTHKQLDRWIPMEVVSLSILYSVAAVIVGYISAMVMNKIHIQDMTLHYLAALMVYATCECVDISGILGIFVYGSILNCPKEVENAVGSLALMIESAVYLFLGLSLYSYNPTFIGTSFLILLSCISARVIVVFIVGSLLRCCGHKYWSFRSLLFFSMCGVRGAISFALSQNLNQKFSMETTFVVIITTMLILGSLQKCMYTLLLTNDDIHIIV